MPNDGRPTLVTGASGCIGAWVVRDLLQRGAPVACFDLNSDRRRLKLLMGDAADSVPWVQGDVGDFKAVEAAVKEHQVGSIIHLAALQVPFCRADPLAGVRVNVGGFLNILETGRLLGVSRIVYASSIAALPLGDAEDITTLYGAFKAADEAIAGAYWNEFQVASIGLRPAPIFGLGRDQGMTSLPTVAMLAAVLNAPFTIPFAGPLVFQHAGDVAKVFCDCLALKEDGAKLYNLGGASIDVAEIVDTIRQAAPDAQIRVVGKPLPFPTVIDDQPLREKIGDWQVTSIPQRIHETIADFRSLHARGVVGHRDINISTDGHRGS